jgi:hypothetical protein
MKNRNELCLETSANEIEVLSQKIRGRIVALDKKLVKHASDKESVTVFTQKKNVLTAALSYLSGDDVDLDAVIKSNPRYDNYYWVHAWYSGTSGNTIDLVNAVSKIKKPAVKNTPVTAMTDNSSVMSCENSISSDVLFSVPQEVFASALTNNVMSTLSNTCHHFHTLFKQPLINRALMTLWQAVIDDDRELIKRILDEKPELLLIDPPQDFVIESQLTWQKIYAENPLTMAAKRKQIKMIELLLPYYDRLPQTESVMKAKEKGLSAWVYYEIVKNNQGKDEILIPQEYADYALALINVFSQETFPNGIPGENDIPMTVEFSEETEGALNQLFNKLLPEHAVKLDDCFDMELLLLAVYKSYVKNFNLFQNWKQRDAFCVRVIGLIQCVQSPETAKIFCEDLDGVVSAQQKGQEKEISEQAKGHKLKDGATFYRLCRESLAGLGFNFLCGIFGASRAGTAVDGPERAQALIWKNYVEQKQQIFGMLRSEFGNSYTETLRVIGKQAQ